MKGFQKYSAIPSEAILRVGQTLACGLKYAVRLYQHIRDGQTAGQPHGPPRWVVWPQGASRWLLWPILMAVFFFWQQWQLVENPRRISPEWRTLKTTAIHSPNVYDYGMFYWGLVPVYSTYVDRSKSNNNLYSKEAAERILIERGETLSVEHYPGRPVRNGERTLKLAPLPLALIRGSAYKLGMTRSYAFVHALALVVLTFALWRYAPFPLCIVLPLILSSSEFAACEMYFWHRPVPVPITFAAFSGVVVQIPQETDAG